MRLHEWEHQLSISVAQAIQRGRKAAAVIPGELLGSGISVSRDAGKWPKTLSRIFGWR
jgi:hypothetical protein